MRWIFANLDDRDEADQYARTIERIDRWWHEFEATTGRLDDFFRGRERWDLPRWMSDHLHAVDPRLMWEFGPGAQGDGHRLVITPELERQLRPMVQTLLERAPRLPGWEFHAYRPAESLADARRTVQGRTGGDLSKMRVRATIGELHTVDVLYLHPRLAKEENNARGDAFVATEALLGEEMLDAWVAGLDAVAANDGGRWLPLERLRPTVEALVGGLIDQLPARPCYRIDPRAAEWTDFEGRPEEADDYPAQADVRLARTMLPKMWLNVHSEYPFYSARYSRWKETFAYVKIDGGDLAFEQRIDVQRQLEPLLDVALRTQALGAATGGGAGLRYAYVDLALTDLRRAAGVVRQVLAQHGVPLRSWILFPDATLQDEWVGAWDATPPPP